MNRFFISWQYCLTLIMAVLIAGCSSISETQAVEITPTPTITPVPEVAPSITPIASACEGLSGTLEVMILAGPAEVVGLEPYTIGHIPFMVESQDGINIVQGGGPISYADILVEEWGTYEVTLDFSTSIEGICSGVAGAEKLQLDLLMGGDQNVIVEAEGFSGEYPWAGEIKRELEFPLVNGASNEGEGWAVVLHLNTK